MNECREAFEKWAYGSRYVPDPSSDIEANCWLAWDAAWSACTESTNRDEIDSKLVDAEGEIGLILQEIKNHMLYSRERFAISTQARVSCDDVIALLDRLIALRVAGMPSPVVNQSLTTDQRMHEWQPIETAPKDGRTLLLGHRNTLGNWRTLRGRWIPKAEIEEHWEEDDFPEGFYEEAVEADEPNCWPTDPTHWMPLPEPPKS